MPLLKSKKNYIEILDFVHSTSALANLCGRHFQYFILAQNRENAIAQA